MNRGVVISLHSRDTLLQYCKLNDLRFSNLSNTDGTWNRIALHN